MVIRMLLQRTQLYSEELGIDLSAGDDREYFKWFLASVLFGGRIIETIARNTYRALVRHELVTPLTITAAGWDFLVNVVMREGGYVRYDGRMSTQLLRDSEKLMRDYRGSLRRVHDEAAGERDLEDRLMAFYGIGSVPANIFLRELRPCWPKADPEPSESVREAARRLGIDLGAYKRKSITLVRIEAGLIRLRHELGRKRRDRANA